MVDEELLLARRGFEFNNLKRFPAKMKDEDDIRPSSVGPSACLLRALALFASASAAVVIAGNSR